MTEQYEQMGLEFVRQYYDTFQKNRKDLAQLYHESAWLTFEDNRVTGREAITQVLTGKLQFKSILHSITKIDCQLTVDKGILIFVTGQLKTDDDPPHAFSQMFYLKECDGSYFVVNDIFRLSIHDIS